MQPVPRRRGHARPAAARRSRKAHGGAREPAARPTRQAQAKKKSEERSDGGGDGPPTCRRPATASSSRGRSAHEDEVPSTTRPRSRAAATTRRSRASTRSTATATARRPAASGRPTSGSSRCPRSGTTTASRATLWKDPPILDNPSERGRSADRDLRALLRRRPPEDGRLADRRGFLGLEHPLSRSRARRCWRSPRARSAVRRARPRTVTPGEPRVSEEGADRGGRRSAGSAW